MKMCLVLSANADVSAECCNIFRDYGFCSIEFSDSNDSLIACGGLMPDVIVIDSNLLGCDSIPNYVDCVMAAAVHEKPSIFFLSDVMHDNADLQKMESSGIVSFIRKPIDSADILSKLMQKGILKGVVSMDSAQQFSV